MKIQALALGAALGFLVAIAPSCGTNSCSAANCDGCCKGTTCVAKPNNSNNTSCGTSANTCADCTATGTTCDSTTFTCGSSGTGGGAGGGTAGGGAGGGSTTCDGCRLSNGTCQARGSTRQNNNICGAGGELCKACTAPTPTCENGACIAPPKKVGDSCQTDTECQTTLGAAAVCKQQNLKGSISYAGGLCTIPNCAANGTDMCPMGSVCLNFPRIFGEETSYCFVTACNNMTAPCRSGYSCFNLGGASMTTACLPPDINNPDLELDTINTLHNPCTLNSDCRAPVPGAPAAGGVCQPEVLRRADGGIIPGRDGGPQFSGNPGGQCTRLCRIDEDCTFDGNENLKEGLCLGVSQTVAICFKGCNAPNGGQSNCREGYICEQAIQTFDGGRNILGYCDGRCDIPGGSCGNYPDGGPRACLSNGYCDIERFDAGAAAGGGAAGGGAAGGGSAGGGAAGGGADDGGVTDGGATDGGATDAG
jgi:hypothetical protein